MFHVGQKVVCIKGHPEYVGCVVPVVGSTYTIRGVDETCGLLFEEIINRIATCFDLSSGAISYGECSFWIDRFRPVIERKTDISTFTEMLTPNRVREPA